MGAGECPAPIPTVWACSGSESTAKTLLKCFFLSLGELEACASALLAVLLALLTTRVAGNEAFCLERLAELGVEFHEGACDAELDGVGLAHDAATLDGGDDVEGLADVGDAERALGGCALLSGDEVDVRLLPLTVNLPLPGRRKTRAIELLRRPVP